jgi:hypothetical protein
MKFPATTRLLQFLCALCVLCGSGFALDREAFSITNYDLNLQLDPTQHRMGVRGKIILRNDSSAPQKVAVLQVSSSLDWRSIKAAGKPLQFVVQAYTSDIDHTGALSEAIVTLPQEVAPHATIDIDIAYEGVILLDATRLTRIGTPDDAAQSSDWDQISQNFTAVRGAGYVAWYPIATDVANLSEGNSLFEVLARWKMREAGSKIKVSFLELNKDEPTQDPGSADESAPSKLLCSGNAIHGETREGTAKSPWAQCEYDDLSQAAPSFVIASYGIVNRPSITVYNFPTHAVAAEAYASAAEKVAPFITDWFGPARANATTADLPDPYAAPFESGTLLLTPLANKDSKLAGLEAVHQLTHAAFSSPRPWINEGLAHFTQALYLEHEKNRQAALDYMGLHRSAFSTLEQPATVPRSEDEVNHSLINTTSEEIYRSKAMCVWWMLRDMIGDAALKKAIAAYKPELDKEPSYMQRLISAQTQRDLEWFFDDWVYRDRGLPDFTVEAASPRKTPTETFLTAVTVANLGTAGAEVPVTVKFASGEVVKRIEVRAKSQNTIRIETPAAPTEVIVNDGSVPESDLTNNVFKVEAPQK